mmetsp:Transcript_17183/g.30911  ORF Transcript_17183/g.30911 Transcript_17183/m.30911 type:complete len:598 (-) Transcript_17183:943-2736(-)
MDSDTIIALNCRHSSELPTQFPEQLIALDLSYNKLASVPVLSNIKRLQRLDLSNNHLTEVESLSQCFTLQELNLASNLLRSIHGLHHLTELVRLNLESNLIQTVADIRPLSFNSKLKVLVVKDNPVASLKSYKPTINSVLPNLQMLDNTRRAKLNATFARVSTSFFSQAIETVCKSLKPASPQVEVAEVEEEDDNPAFYKPRSQAELGRVKRTLRTIYYFSELSAAHITLVLKHFYLVSFQTNEVLISVRSKCEVLIIVLSGELLYKGKRIAADGKLFVDSLFVTEKAEDDVTCALAGEAILLTRESLEQADLKSKGLLDIVRAVHSRANIIPVEIKKNLSENSKLAKAVTERLHNSVRKQSQPIQFSFSPNTRRSKQSTCLTPSLRGSILKPEESSRSKVLIVSDCSQFDQKEEITRPKSPELESFDTELSAHFSPQVSYEVLYEELIEEMTTCKSTLCSLIVLSQDLESVTPRQTENYRTVLTECDLLKMRRQPALKDASDPIIWKINEMIEQSNALKLKLIGLLEAVEQRDISEIVKLRYDLIRNRMIPIEKLPLSLQRISDFVDAFHSGRAEIERAAQPIGDLSFTSSQTVDL